MTDRVRALATIGVVSTVDLTGNLTRKALVNSLVNVPFTDRSRFLSQARWTQIACFLSMLLVIAGSLLMAVLGYGWLAAVPILGTVTAQWTAVIRVTRSSPTSSVPCQS